MRRRLKHIWSQVEFSSSFFTRETSFNFFSHLLATDRKCAILKYCTFDKTQAHHRWKCGYDNSYAKGIQLVVYTFIRNALQAFSGSLSKLYLLRKGLVFLAVNVICRVNSNFDNSFSLKQAMKSMSVFNSFGLKKFFLPDSIIGNVVIVVSNTCTRI